MDKIVLQSLASDLKRVALAIQRNSSHSSLRFQQEALRWLNESKGKISKKDDSISKLLAKVERCLQEDNDLNKAEDLLMFSTLIQNRSTA